VAVVRTEWRGIAHHAEVHTGIQPTYAAGDIHPCTGCYSVPFTTPDADGNIRLSGSYQRDADGATLDGDHGAHTNPFADAHSYAHANTDPDAHSYAHANTDPDAHADTTAELLALKRRSCSGVAWSGVSAHDGAWGEKWKAEGPLRYIARGVMPT
jgi:hypothetical protein